MIKDRLKHLREAKALTKIIKEGRLDRKDIHLLIREGLDSQTVKVWEELDAYSNSLDDLLTKIDMEITSLIFMKDRLDDLSKGSG